MFKSQSKLFTSIFKYYPFFSNSMQDKKLEKTRFDEFTAEKPWHTFTDYTYNKIIMLFLKLNPKKTDRIIDMGCGTGELTEKIYGLSFKNISGYDISKNCILMASKNFPGINFEVKDIEKTRLKANSVDFLFYCGILHHFTDTKKVVKEAKRILKKKGKVFVFEPNAINPVLWLFRDERSPFKSNKMKTPNERFMTKEQIKNVFDKEGFKCIKIDCISGISYTKGYFKRLFPFPLFYIVYFYNLFDFLLNITPFRRKFGSFIYGYFGK